MIKYDTIAVIGRFKPVTNRSARWLDALCANSRKVIIGIGSSNKFNVRNPFTADETKDMIELVLKEKYGNYEIVYIPDFAQSEEINPGEKWKKFVLKRFGKIDALVTKNPFVTSLLENEYKIINPKDILPMNPDECACARDVRKKIVDFDEWKCLTPKLVCDYLEKNDLIERFRRKFGTQTIIEIDEYYELEKIDPILAEKTYSQKR